MSFEGKGSDFTPSEMTPRPRKFISYKGKTMSVMAWGRLLGIKADTIRNRMKKTDDPEILLRTDNLKRKLL